MATLPEDYNVGWICAIEPERIIACELLDEEYTGNRIPYIDSQRDHNIYTFGRMHQHRVVIAGLPQGRYGISSATRVAEHMQASFPALQIALMVGIAGGVPSHKRDIRLGDVVVSCPARNHCGVIHYDFGKATQNQAFEETGHLASPPNILLNAVAVLKARHKRDGHRILSTIAGVLKNRRLKAEYSRPGPRMDRLYRSDYIHSQQEACDCQELLEIRDDPDSDSHLIQRSPRGPDEDDPTIHYGLIASADRLVKDARLRDSLSQKLDVLCFEMEAAGLMNSDLRFLVIRGICDYADTHKNDAWQGYAAATAAAYAKELLELISPSQSRQGAIKLWKQPVNKSTSDISRSTRDSEDAIVRIEPVIPQQSLALSVQENINTFLTSLRNTFMRAQETSRDIRIDVCIEIAKQSDQMKTSIRVKQPDVAEDGQDDIIDQDQVLLHCISRCAKRKPSEAAEGLSRVFSGSADFFFERGNNFYPEQYSVNQSLSDRMFFIASRESYTARGYSIEVFFNYLVKRRRWQRIHMFITTAEKTGDLVNFPMSTDEFTGFIIWMPPPSILQILQSILQDLDLSGPVARIDLPLSCDIGNTFRYDFESIQNDIDYEQRNLIEPMEDKTIRYLQELGCKQFRESQLSTLKRTGGFTFHVTDGSANYKHFPAPFARTVRDLNEFELFIQRILRAQKLSTCQRAAKFIGVVLDDHRNHITGYLMELGWSTATDMLSAANLIRYTIPRTLRRLWAKQLIIATCELHSMRIAGCVMHPYISHSLNLIVHEHWITMRNLNMHNIPRLFAVERSAVTQLRYSTPETLETIGRRDIFELGFLLWQLSEHVPYAGTYLCKIVGCTTRPYYNCFDEEHRKPVSLPHSQQSDPILRNIINKCRVQDPRERPSARELADEITDKISLEENDVEISRQKKALRVAMASILDNKAFLVSCDECMLPTSSWYHCSICWHGDFDLCDSCFSSGVRCPDGNHQLSKLRTDAFGSTIQENQRPS